MSDPRVRLANGVAPEAAVPVLRALDKFASYFPSMTVYRRRLPAPAAAAVPMAARLFAQVEVRRNAMPPSARTRGTR